jgi:aspartyl-tRNA(Asn)/glutamyl-tRNA(Gln) amidotransferase subunit A
MTDLTATSLTELRRALTDRSIGSVELTRAYLDRIEQYDQPIGAYLQVFADRALERAEAVDRGELTGPLAGVPISLKDNLCTTFGRTTCASRMLEKFQSPYDASVVRRLEAAGAIVLGKTNMDEFAMGSSCEHSALGRTRNPWDTRRVTGGSSGGAAAAMAADLCAASIGSDTGGSIRQPAALCGVVGLKPTYGLVSRYGLVAFASSLDQIGPITRSVEDAAELLNVIAGHDPLDSTSAEPSTTGPLPDYTAQLDQPVRPLRIGLASQHRGQGNDPAVEKTLDQAVETYRQFGAEIVPVDLPHSEYGIAAYYLLSTAEASSNLARYDGVHYGHRADDVEDLVDLYAASRAQGFGDEVKRRIMLGAYALSSGYYDAYYLKALKVRRLIRGDFDAAFEKCDAVLAPTTATPAFRVGEKTDDPLAMYLADVYTVNINMAGIPGISFPAGHVERDGRVLPIGLQLIGPTFSEAKLLRVAAMFQQATGFHTRRPALAGAEDGR